MTKKKAGIVVDNYKLSKFKKELTKAGFTDFKVITFMKDTSTIQVEIEDNQKDEIRKICQLCELHFKRGN